MLDSTLLSRAADGDHAALGKLYDAYGRRAYGLALRITVDPRLAEDAVQEAFLQVWRRAGDFDPARGSVSTWLLTIVHRRAVDVVRREGKHRRPVPAALEEIHVEATAELSAPPVERDRLRAALDLLPDAQREALALAYFGGLTQSEVARHTGQPLGTVKSRMFTALASLRQSLAAGPAA